MPAKKTRLWSLPATISPTAQMSWLVEFGEFKLPMCIGASRPGLLSRTRHLYRAVDVTVKISYFYIILVQFNFLPGIFVEMTFKIRNFPITHKSSFFVASMTFIKL
jgi:hypothetical protein